MQGAREKWSERYVAYTVIDIFRESNEADGVSTGALIALRLFGAVS